MQRTYFQGLKLKPSFDQIVGYLENDQQFMSHPDRTYTRLKNDQYYSNLNMAGVNSINAQSDNLLKEQAKQLNRTQQMQTLGLSQPQVTAANIASGSGAPIGQQFDIATPPRPLFLPDQDPDDTLLPGRGSVPASGFATPIDPDVVMERLEVVARQREAEQEAKRRRVQGEVASASASGLSSFARQREESAERRRLEHGSGASSARNRGTSPYQARPRAHSEGSRVKTVFDFKQGDAGQSASGSQDVPRGRSSERVGRASASTDTMTQPLVTVPESKIDKIDFSLDKKASGTSMVDIDDPFQYYSNKTKNIDGIRKEFEKRKDLTFDAAKSKMQLIAELMNYDRTKAGISGRAIIKKVGNSTKIHIEYETAKKKK